ncbi:uncharacterized protein BP5553_03515 [Venustampulla echinocandica]|uniref:CCHC-type domain-containing protein n=1 Tax=Venustampulla echinocandica TaxID=2656787 RepID=A0A370TUG5_9HELO|nr:uncharacterized protein BP5553_03515 [Venustampulla echinocandica]RDL39175.1 hypothetical protein BP5553_03515 [Venustampulla echinocandica]
MAEEPTNDSRTSVVGRKRDLQDASQYREPPNMDDSSDEDSYGRSFKRVKQARNSDNVTKMDDSLATGGTSPLPVDVSSYGEASKFHGHREESLHTPNIGAEILSVHPKTIETAGKSLEVPSHDPAGVATAPAAKNGLASTHSIDIIELPAAPAGKESMLAPAVEQAVPSSAFPADTLGATVSGWNKGVQSGLRTSFGSRPLSAQANVRVEDPGLSDGGPQRGEDNKQVSRDASRSSSGTDDQEHPMFTFGGSSSSQAPGPKPKAKFQPLSKAAIKKLQPDQREAYTKAKAADKAQRKEDAFQSKTAEAELAIAQEGRWPLPEQYGGISKLVRGGETYYAQLDREYKPFKPHSITFDTLCIFDDKGMPIKAQNFSFNLFAPAFLKTNSERLRSLKLKDLRLAFYHYCNLWYCHVGRHLQPLLATAKAHGAFTFEQAMQHAGLSSMRTNTQQIPTRDGLVQAPSKSSKQVGKGQDHASLARPVDTFHGDIESQIDESGLSNRVNSDRQHANPSNQPDLSTAEIQDSDTPMVSGVALTSGHDAEVTEFITPELELDRELQLKYFPSVSTELAILRCLACGDAGHGIQACPALFCTLCGENGRHSNFTCPSKQRCGKCRQRGHYTLMCPEKLFATGAEAGGCDICGSTNHSECACHFIWRSFAPQLEEIHTVCNIPVYCYTCGANGHYGPECGLHTRSLLSGGYTWSKSNLKKYIDPASQDRALSAAVDYSIPKPKEFSIKGKGRANDPFTIEESDDENDFIRPKIEKPGPRGHIHFAERPGAGNSVLDNAPNGPRARSSYQQDNLSYNVAMDSAASSNYPPPNGYTPNIPAAEGYREASGQFRFNGNQRDLGGSNGNGKHGGAKKRKMRNQGGNQAGHAPNNPNQALPTKPKKKSGAKNREKAAKNTR